MDRDPVPNKFTASLPGRRGRQCHHETQKIDPNSFGQHHVGRSVPRKGKLGIAIIFGHCCGIAAAHGGRRGEG
jgi:hypothetical protein